MPAPGLTDCDPGNTLRGLSEQPTTGDAAKHPTIEDAWSPRDEAWRSRSPSSFAAQSVRPLFIGACPRSGTTLLRSLVDNHPHLAMPPETNFVIPLWRGRVGYGDLRRPENRRAIGEWIFQPGHGGPRIRETGIPERRPSREEAIERLVAAPPTLGSLIAECFAIHAHCHDKPRWGDKRPAYAGYASMLFDLFPDAQFVNVVRDPRGAASSLIGLGWHRPKVATAAGAATWVSSVRRVDELASGLRPDQLLDVRYEDFVRAPEDTLRAVCRFAGLDDGDESIEQMLTGERRGSFRPGWHEKLREPISTAPIANWREKLNHRQTALIEHAARPYLDRFGYVALERKPPRPEDVEELDGQLERRRRKWRAEDREERKRRLRHRFPVKALPGDRGEWPRKLRRA